MCRETDKVVDKNIEKSQVSKPVDGGRMQLIEHCPKEA
jgi:hypothetical protein